MSENLIPFGFTRYSIEYPKELEPGFPSDILPDSTIVEEIQRWWNTEIEPIPEQEWLGMSGADMNHWHVFDGPARGVCHDYACTKRHTLAQYLGFGGNLALAWLHRDSDGARVDHLVLLVRIGDGIKVLDNLFRDIYPLEDARGYTWIARQKWDDLTSWEPMAG